MPLQQRWRRLHLRLLYMNYAYLYEWCLRLALGEALRQGHLSTLLLKLLRVRCALAHLPRKRRRASMRKHRRDEGALFRSSLSSLNPTS